MSGCAVTTGAKEPFSDWILVSDRARMRLCVDESGCRARFDHGRERNVFTLLVACGLGPEFIQAGVTTNQSGPADKSSPMDPAWSLTVPQYCDASP